MKRLLVAIAILTCATSPAFAGEKVLIGVDATYPPFEFKNPDGKFVGFDIDLGNEICRRAQLDCEYVQSSFDGLIPGLVARKFRAVLSSLSSTEERKKQIAFSDTLYSLKTRLIARSGSGLTPTVGSLKGKSVGVEQGTTQEAYAKQVWKPAGVQVRSYQSQEQAYSDLVNGRLDATLMDEVQGKMGFLDRPQGEGFAFAGPALPDTEILVSATAMGIRKDDPDLKSKVDSALKGVLADGTYKKIESKYFDFDVYGR